MTLTRETFSHEDVIVRLQGAHGAFDGVLFESRVEGVDVLITVDFPHRGAPELFVGEEVHLAFPHSESSSKSSITATVVLRTEDPFRRRFQLQVGESEKAVVASAESRRGPQRVVPSTEEPVLAFLEHPGRSQPIEVGVHDVSTSGISLLVAPEEETGLSNEWQVRMRLHLPTGESPMEIVGTVRYRRLAGESIHYGVEFDAGRTPSFEAKSERLADYVQRRQVQSLARS